MTKVLSHQLPPLLTTAPRREQVTYAAYAPIDSTCHKPTGTTRQDARSSHRMQTTETRTRPAGVAGERPRNTSGGTSSHQVYDGLDTAVASPAAVSDQPETAPPSVQGLSHKPSQQVVPTDAAPFQQKAVSALCSNHPAGSGHQLTGYGIRWGHRGHNKRRKDAAAGGAVQRARKRQAAISARCSNHDPLVTIDSSDKHSQPYPVGFASRHDQTTAAELAAANTEALGLFAPPKQVPQAPPAADFDPEQALALQPVTAAPAETSDQQQPSQLLVRLGQVLLELRRQREAQTGDSTGAQQQQKPSLASTDSATAGRSKSGMKLSMHINEETSVRASSTVKLSQYLTPGLQALVSACIAAPPPDHSPPPPPSAAAVVPATGVNSSLMPDAVTQKQHMLGTAAADSRSSSPIATDPGSQAVEKDSSNQKLPIHYLPKAMRVSYLRSAGFLPPEPSKTAHPTTSKPKVNQQSNPKTAINKKNRKRSYDSETPVVGLWEEREYTLGSDRQRVWEEHKMVMRMMQVALADVPDAAACVREATEIFEARSCVSCWKARPTSGTWYCSRGSCMQQHKERYQGDSATTAKMRAHDAILWRQVKEIVQPVLAERKQKRQRGVRQQSANDAAATSTAQGATLQAAPSSSSAGADGTEQQIAGSTDAALVAVGGQPCTAVAACSSCRAEDHGGNGSSSKQDHATSAVSQASDASAMPELSSVAPSAATSAALEGTSASPALMAEQLKPSKSVAQEAEGQAAAAAGQQAQDAVDGVEDQQPVSNLSKEVPSAADSPSADGGSLQNATAAAVAAAAAADSARPGPTSAAAAPAHLPADADLILDSATVGPAAVKDMTAAAPTATGRLPGCSADAAASPAVLYTPPEVPIKDFTLPDKSFKYMDVKRLWWEHQLHLRVLLIELQDKPKILARVQDVISKVFNRPCLRCLHYTGHKPSTGCWFCAVCQRTWGKSQHVSDEEAWMSLTTLTGLDARYMLRLRTAAMAQLLEQGQAVQRRMQQQGTVLFYAPVAVSGPMLAAATYAPAALTAAAAAAGGSRVAAVPAVLAAAPAGPNE